jgi:hypothetical protein
VWLKPGGNETSGCDPEGRDEQPSQLRVAAGSRLRADSALE